MLQISCPMSKHLRYHKVGECNAADAISRKTGAPVYAGHTRDGRDRTTRLPQFGTRNLLLPNFTVLTSGNTQY